MRITDLSFVIIAHNEQFSLPKCLDSIAGMELQDCEVIIVDSGSTDGTQAAAMSYRDRIQNLRILHITGKQNASVARNAGASCATCNHIFFIDTHLFSIIVVSVSLRDLIILFKCSKQHSYNKPLVSLLAGMFRLNPALP